MNRWVGVVLGDRRFRALRADAADLRQEIGTRLIASLRRGRFDPARDFRKYVQGVARHTARRTLERRRVLRERLAAAVDPDVLDAEGEMVDRLIVGDLLAAASGGCRRLLFWHYVQGLNLHEIAARLDVPIGTVKSRLSRCLAAAQRAGAPGGRRTAMARSSRPRQQT